MLARHGIWLTVFKPPKRVNHDIYAPLTVKVFFIKSKINFFYWKKSINVNLWCFLPKQVWSGSGQIALGNVNLRTFFSVDFQFIFPLPGQWQKTQMRSLWRFYISSFAICISFVTYHALCFTFHISKIYLKHFPFCRPVANNTDKITVKIYFKFCISFVIFHFFNIFLYFRPVANNTDKITVKIYFTFCISFMTFHFSYFKRYIFNILYFSGQWQTTQTRSLWRWASNCLSLSTWY